jgi:uncharacterized protein involved in outer membrane biogenesis
MRKALLYLVLAAALLVIAATAGLYWFFSGDAMRRTLEQQASAWLGQPVQIGGARAQLFPRAGIGLRDVRVGDPVRLTLADVRLSTDMHALFSRRIENASLVLSDSRIEMPLPFAMPDSGAATGSAAPADGGGVELISVREIALRDVRIASRGRDVLVSADSSLRDGTLTITRFTAESEATSLEIDGEVDLEPRVDARLRATASRIDLDELLALAGAITPPPAPAPAPSSRRAPPMRVSAEISAATARAGGIDVGDLSARMTLDGDRVSLTPLTFGLFGGRYEGTLTARLGDAISATLQSRLTNLDVAELAAFGGSPDTITGTLSGNGSFKAQGADVADILASASGSGTASILDGTIKRLNLVRTVVLFFGRPAPDTAAATDRFERMDASFSLARQIFRADSFSLRSADADITGSGTLTLGTEDLDGTVAMMLSEELSAQAGTDLARFTREGNRIVLPANLGGTLSAPRLTIDTAAALKRGLRNEMERRLKGLFGR